MIRSTLVLLAAVLGLSACMSTAVVPPEQRRDDRWRETSEMLSRPPTVQY